MARQDKATDAKAEQFQINKAKILLAASDWDFPSKKYLIKVLDELDVLTAYYSYANGDIYIEDCPTWKALDDDVIISKINDVIEPVLHIYISDWSFPDTLSFEHLGS